MKRRWIGLIILLAVGMSIIGVSKQQRPVQSEDESITLRVVLWDYDVVIYDRELIENFEKDHPDIKIDVISYPPTYYNSSLTALLDSGETVDVIYVNQLDQLSQITDRNLAMPLDSYIRRDGVPTEHYPGLMCCAAKTESCLHCHIAEISFYCITIRIYWTWQVWSIRLILCRG